jgi:hypothetical protein
VPKPAKAGGREIGIDLLDLGVCLIAVRAELASDAALFIASPWGFVEGGVVRIDPGDACAQPADETRALAPSLVKTPPARP